MGAPYFLEHFLARDLVPGWRYYSKVSFARLVRFRFAINFAQKYRQRDLLVAWKNTRWKLNLKRWTIASDGFFLADKNGHLDFTSNPSGQEEGYTIAAAAALDMIADVEYSALLQHPGKRCCNGY